MIFQHSRYSQTTVVNDDGITSFEKRQLKEYDLSQAPTHVVVEAETLESISNMYYGTPQLWWVILDANKDKIPGYFEALIPGMSLNIPLKSEVLY